MPRSPSSHTARGESLCQKDKERRGTAHKKGMSGCQARRSLKFKLMLGEKGIERITYNLISEALPTT